MISFAFVFSSVFIFTGRKIAIFIVIYLFYGSYKVQLSFNFFDGMDYWWEFQVRLACPGPIAGRWMFDTPTFSMCYGADLIRKSKEAGGSPERYPSGMWNSTGLPSDNPNCLKMNVVILFNLSNDVLNHSVGSDSIEIKLENIYQYTSGPRVELQRVTLDGI